ncbi:MAG: SUMF1/EgtB/PvdO family nonheme iron enzyme [Candidatus Riflebacteria bacterium]|nr:SUMF1/EgtB/PvdO family nonheme iron enzyme [Candidatus Riflebacteria bacterium]
MSAFRISKYEITREQFLSIMGTDPSNTERSSGITDPVQMVNWYHALAFCNKLSISEDLEPVYSVSGVNFATLSFADVPTSKNTTWDAAACDWSANGYRLPTMMEWMWAAMGADQDSQPGAMSAGVNVTGYEKEFAGSNGSNSLDAYAWYSENSDQKTHPAGSKLANELGLYDMSGNVYEWCWDRYDSSPAFDVSDYRGPDTGSAVYLKGGDWNSDLGLAVYCYSPGPYYRDAGYGFRVVRP